jgi:hypothetical protein
MQQVKILIYPLNEKMSLPIDNSFVNKISEYIAGCKIIFNNFPVIPEFGFRGFQITPEDNINIYFYGKYIITADGNIISVSIDKKAKFFNLFLNKSIKRYYDEMKYYLDIRNDTETAENKIIGCKY